MLNTTHLKKASGQAALDHCEDANENCFFQFAHDGATLLNKDEHQACGMHFVETKFRHNDAITSLFRKPSLHETDKVAELAEEACNECFELEITLLFLPSV